MKEKIRYVLGITFILLILLSICMIIFGADYNKKEKEIWNEKLSEYQEQADSNLEKHKNLEMLLNEKNLEIENLEKLLNEMNSKNKSMEKLLNEMSSKNKSMEKLLNEMSSKNKSLEKLLNEKSSSTDH